MLVEKIRLLARRYLTRETRRRLARLAIWPPVGWIRFGDLRRLKPISSDYGNSRGLEIDRYYIEKFLAEHAEDIHGNVLEIKHNTYTKKYGQDRVTKSDVLHPVEGNPDATIAQLSLDDFDQWGEYWRFTSLSARLLFEEAFSVGNVSVHPYGNVLAAISSLEGLACEDLKQSELDARDRSFEILIAIRAIKKETAR